MCWEEQGQFTGEISPLMLKEMNLDLVMIGHSGKETCFQRDRLLKKIRKFLQP